MNIEESKDLERVDKIMGRLIKALYCEDDGETIDYATLMCALAKFTATVLLTIQERCKVLDIEEDFTKTLMDIKASLGKGMKMQEIQEERERIKLKIKENEEKIKELEREQEEVIKRFFMSNNDKGS